MRRKVRGHGLCAVWPPLHLLNLVQSDKVSEVSEAVDYFIFFCVVNQNKTFIFDTENKLRFTKQKYFAGQLCCVCPAGHILSSRMDGV